MSKPKFQIGDWVRSDAHYTKYRLAATSGWVRTVTEKPIVGRIVGGCWKQSGVLRGGCGYGEDYEGKYLEVKETHFLFEVKEGFTNKPKYVAEDDIIVTFFDQGDDVPFRKVNVSDADKKWLSEQAKEWPRDEKGRFK